MGNPVEPVGPHPARLRASAGALLGWDAPPGAPVAAAVSAPDRYAFVDAAEGAGPAAGGIGGGPGFAAHAVFSVVVSEVDEALRDAERLGGTVVSEAQRNEGGGVTVGHFRDPAGDLVGVAGPR